MGPGGRRGMQRVTAHPDPLCLRETMWAGTGSIPQCQFISQNANWMGVYCITTLFIQSLPNQTKSSFFSSGFRSYEMLTSLCRDHNFQRVRPRRASMPAPRQSSVESVEAGGFGRWDNTMGGRGRTMVLPCYLLTAITSRRLFMWSTQAMESAVPPKRVLLKYSYPWTMQRVKGAWHPSWSRKARYKFWLPKNLTISSLTWSLPNGIQR